MSKGGMHGAFKSSDSSLVETAASSTHRGEEQAEYLSKWGEKETLWVHLKKQHCGNIKSKCREWSVN